MELLEHAKRQLLFLTGIEQSIQSQQKDTPKEKLRVSKSNGVFQYYTIKNGKRCYIRKKNLKTAQAIAQRDYNKKLPAARKLLIKPAFIDNETYAQQWQAQQYEPNSDLPEGSFQTTKGEHVRSKSEIIIAAYLI